jgi:hypothetical protein
MRWSTSQSAPLSLPKRAWESQSSPAHEKPWADLQQPRHWTTCALQQSPSSPIEQGCQNLVGLNLSPVTVAPSMAGAASVFPSQTRLLSSVTMKSGHWTIHTSVQEPSKRIDSLELCCEDSRGLCMFGVQICHTKRKP